MGLSREFIYVMCLKKKNQGIETFDRKIKRMNSFLQVYVYRYNKHFVLKGVSGFKELNK